MTLTAGTVVGSYRIDGLVGRGGMATVYRARHIELEREVALKVLAEALSADPEFVARFRREGRVQASLEHPHVVTIYEAGESEHGLYLAMRLIPGSSLAGLIHERTLDATRALTVLRQVAEALDAAHAAGLVHRDVKPQNVLVGDAGDAYLGDFGLTRVGGATGVTATGKLLGTLAYLSPEVIRGGEARPASDRYAFAAVAFECLTGSVVYPRRTEAAVLYAHTSEPPPRISVRRAELPSSLDHVFARALSKDPNARPADAVALVEAVKEALDAAGTHALGPPPPIDVAAPDATTVEPEPLAHVEPPRPIPRARLALWLASAALAGAAVMAAVGAVVVERDGSSAAAVPPPLPGAQVLGSELSRPGKTLDCTGRSPRADSPSCTVAQAELPRQVLVVPDDGVVRRWAIRSARGEVALAVLRPRDNGALQIARSRNEFVGNDGVHVFPANLAVQRGDLLALVLIPGSGVGARPGVEGATTMRWIPSLSGFPEPAPFEPGSGFDHELLLRVEYFPGERQQVPEQVTGPAAARLEIGLREFDRRSAHFTNGRAVEIALVEVDDRVVLDQFLDGRRAARMDLPGLRARGGRVVDFVVSVDTTQPEVLYIDVQYANDESARIRKHYICARPFEFEFVN